MRTRLPALLAALLLPLTLASPAVAAPGVKHGSCKELGHSFKAWAQGELDPAFGSPGTVMPVLAQSSPGGVAAALHAEMTMELEMFPGTPYCDPHP